MLNQVHKVSSGTWQQAVEDAL